MPVWLSILLAVLGGSGVISGGYFAARRDVRDDLSAWRDEAKALRERIVATEERLEECEADCDRRIADLRQFLVGYIPPPGSKP